MTKPIFLHMLGIPGAGKTTFLTMLDEMWTLPPHPGLLGFDQVMQAMPDYAAFADKVEAFKALELPARERGYALLDSMMEQGQSLFFDNGGSASSHLSILEKAQQKGYRVVIVSITTSIDAAKERVDERAVTEGRHTPMEYLEDRLSKIGQLEQSYRSLTPHFYQIENNGKDRADFEVKCRNMAQEILHDMKETQGERS